MSPSIVVIDNYDSFVYILAQYLGELGAVPDVHRHDAITVDEIERLDPDGLLISPGPGTPDDAGISNEVVSRLGGELPMLGVCLGLQCIAQSFGARVERAARVMHGKTSLVHHDGTGVFSGLPQPLEATRYHSLIVARDSVPDDLEISAETEDGIVMGLRHREHDIEGVQFHPESVLTSSGHALIENFVARCAA